MVTRDIVEIDEEKCDGCGLCVPSCAEGAIRIVDGKARLLSDVYCDGLGACLGHCPRGAITIVRREAVAFDEAAAARHLAATAAAPPSPSASMCPSAKPENLRLNVLTDTPAPLASRKAGGAEGQPPPALANWPIQLHLVPPNAHFLQDCDLMLVADCVPFACPDFHRQLLKDKPVVVGCPKLDDADFYVKKLAAILTQANVQSITIVHMEVPCCTGLVRIAQAACSLSGREPPMEDCVVTIRGQIQPGKQGTGD
jgi:Pyruvate/2-oxoacid:ferredoxin oxidoreductase delta subunit